MAETDKLTTVVSARGQVLLPSVIRRARDWKAGTRLTIEETSEGVLLKPARRLRRRGRKRCSASWLIEASRKHPKRWTQASLPKRGGMIAIEAYLNVRDLAGDHAAPSSTDGDRALQAAARNPSGKTPEIRQPPLAKIFHFPEFRICGIER